MLIPILLATVLQAQDTTFFETKVRPVFARQCYSCHGPDKQFSNLRLDSREALLKGGNRGPALQPGNTNSLLLQAIRHETIKMPMGTKLKDNEIADITTWIQNGAPWPAGAATAKPASIDDHYRRLTATHWAFQPVKAQPAKLPAMLATPGQPIDKRLLIRRAYYILTGLPPTAEDTDRFLADTSPQAYTNLINKLLANPQYGEQWARHWMDVVRFGETRGYEWNYEILGAWRYRDYLIRAFNADVPYDQLIREHIAGDLLKTPRVNAKEQLNESIIGTAFYRLGEAGHDDCIQFRELATDVIDNQIDTLTKAFQGLTVSCARCHNHKLDPILTEDYYALYGILNSSRHVTLTTDTPDANAAIIRQLRALKQQAKQQAIYTWRNAAPTLSDKAGKLEDPSYPWANFTPDTWQSLAERYKKQAAENAAFNKANFTPLPLTQWHISGQGLRDGITKAGTTDAAQRILPTGLFTHTDSMRLNGAIRSPLLPPNKKFVSIRAMGGVLGSHRRIVDNCAIGEGNKVLDTEKLTWHKTPTQSEKHQLPNYIELITRYDNPRIPDRPGVLKNEQLKQMDDPRSWFGITHAVVHDIDETPREDLSHMLRLFDGPAPNNKEELAARYRAIINEALTRWEQNKATDDDIPWLNLLPPQQPTTEYQALEAQLKEPRVVEGLTDIGEGRDFPVFKSGSPLNLGDPAPRRFLFYLNGDRRFHNGSGRLELAETIANPANPLTARVMVNRIWHHVFGRGLVLSVDNFGILADKPEQLELLDTLAAKFTEDGWSIKNLLKTLLTSPAFQSQQGPFQMRRLTAEQLRDSILAASGSLKPVMFGPSVHPFRDKPQDYRRLFAGPLDGDGRRSLYTKVTRMEGARFLETFDYPNPMAARGARDITNVPAQALTLLNDPFVIAQSEALAKRVMTLPQDQRLSALFRFTLGHDPNPSERARFEGLARELASLTTQPRESLAVWSQLAHALFNLKEFLYIQ
ncbi:MAG: PSD1 domain-containing protein [Acidobacteria bacterium]|nr:PSD1 domain-containing protein [Acidobacteriota bacterium]